MIDLFWLYEEARGGSYCGVFMLCQQLRKTNLNIYIDKAKDNLKDWSETVITKNYITNEVKYER